MLALGVDDRGCAGSGDGRPSASSLFSQALAGDAGHACTARAGVGAAGLRRRHAKSPRRHEPRWPTGPWRTGSDRPSEAWRDAGVAMAGIAPDLRERPARPGADRRGAVRLDSTPMLDDGPRTSSTGSSTRRPTRSGHFSPIGNGWWPRGGDEVARSTSNRSRRRRCCSPPSRPTMVTGDDKYRAAMERAYAWFLGENDLASPSPSRSAEPASMA